MLTDWHDFHHREMRRPAIVEPRRRLRICLAVFVLGLLVVFGRAADCDPGLGAFNLVSAGNDDVFISKLDASGNFVWAVASG